MVAVDMPNFLPSMAFRAREGTSCNDSSMKAESGVKAFVNGMMTPFTSCWQPPIDPCAPVGCSSSRYPYFDQQPAVVSPGRPSHLDLPTSPIRDMHSPQSERSYAAAIEQPRSHDVLCGRGGSSNRHLGNMNFRELVAANKKTYVGLTKKQKMLVARKIVNLVGQTEPSGRFLAKDSHTGMWYNIGLPRSLEKTSQALREKNSNDTPGGTPSDDVVSTSPGTASEDPRKSFAMSLEAPPLVVPSHLTEIFYPSKAQEAGRPGWPNYEAPVQEIQQPFLRPSPSSCPPSPSQGYQVAPRAHRQRHTESPRYCSPRYAHTESPSPEYRDYRDHPDYYPRTERYFPQSRHVRFQPPRRYQPYPQTPIHQSMRNHYHHSPRMVAGVPPPRPMPASPLRFDEDPAGYGRPYLPSMPPQRTAESPHSAGTPPVYRTPSHGHVRGRSGLPPQRPQGWKRQRSQTGLSPPLSDASLSSAVKDSLSLGERTSGLDQIEVKSPSGFLQGRSHRSAENRKCSNVQTFKHDGLSGLAALSTAAFLKLDDTSS